MHADPNKIAVALLGKKGGDGAEAQHDDAQEPLDAAAQDLMDALKGGSPQDVASALRSAFQLMDSPPPDESGE